MIQLFGRMRLLLTEKQHQNWTGYFWPVELITAADHHQWHIQSQQY